MFFWNSLAFSTIQRMLAIWSLVSLHFLNPAWTSGCLQFTYCRSLAWRILSIPLLVCEMSAIVWYFEHSLALPFFRIGNKTHLFQSCGLDILYILIIQRNKVGLLFWEKITDNIFGHFSLKWLLYIKWAYQEGSGYTSLVLIK